MTSELIETLPPIDLDTLRDLNCGRRRDRKYILTDEAADDFAASLPLTTMVLTIDDMREFGYESMYFDTGDLMCFHMAARGRRRRFKIRTRHYLATDQTWLEVKTKGPRGLTVKDRTQFDGCLDLTWVQTILAIRGIVQVPVDQLVPTAEVSYTRSTLLLPDLTRITIDKDLHWHSYETTRSLPGQVIVETKTPGHANLADRWLWGHGIRPTRISKYATGMAMLFPELASNRWHRTLARLHEIQEKDNETTQSFDIDDSLFGAADSHRLYAHRLVG